MTNRGGRAGASHGSPGALPRQLLSAVFPVRELSLPPVSLVLMHRLCVLCDSMCSFCCFLRPGELPPR
jgi:hypothetical protein